METKELIELALEAHISCCPYMTDQMGEKISPFSDITARCGANRLYCTEDCYYIKTFKKVLKRLIKEAES